MQGKYFLVSEHSIWLIEANFNSFAQFCFCLFAAQEAKVFCSAETHFCPVARRQHWLVIIIG